MYPEKLIKTNDDNTEVYLATTALNYGTYTQLCFASDSTYVLVNTSIFDRNKEIEAPTVLFKF